MNKDKKPYSSPTLTSFGDIADVVKANRGPGGDGAGVFPDDMAS